MHVYELCVHTITSVLYKCVLVPYAYVPRCDTFRHNASTHVIAKVTQVKCTCVCVRVRELSRHQ